MGEKYWWQKPTERGGLAKTKLLAGWFVENEVASSHVVRFWEPMDLRLER